MGNETAGSGRFKRVSSGRNHAKIKGGGQKGAGTRDAKCERRKF